jgi:hypothetical protein
MAENIRIQTYLMSIKGEIWDLHIRQNLSVNDVHRELVHHRDTWFTYATPRNTPPTNRASQLGSKEISANIFWLGTLS